MAFKLPAPIGNEIPMSDLHVWTWAKTQPRADVTTANYLQSVGFVTGQDTINEEEYAILKHGVEAFHRTAPHMQPSRFSAVFTRDDAAKCTYPNGSRGPAGFWVRGKPGRYLLSDAGRAALAGAGWIYDITPQTTHFEIINGKVWAKYQTIIGSRSLFEIVEPEELRLTRLTNNANGNPRYAVHFLQCLPESARAMPLEEKYPFAVKLMHAAGGRKYHNRRYGGGIVFTSYAVDELAQHIGEIVGREFVPVVEH